MTILVTGGAGFVGGHVVETLLDRGDTVVCVDDLNDYYDPKLKQVVVEAHRKHPRYTFVQLDIGDRVALEKLFEQHTITSIIHLAARAGVRASIDQPDMYLRTNIQGTLNLLELGRKYALLNIVAASSSSVYGNMKTVPFTETMMLDSQISPYAVSKKSMENLCYCYSHLYALPITCLRFFTVYGPRGRPDMAPYLFVDSVLQGKPITVFGDGSTSRDYTYVGDIVSGILAAHNRPRPFLVANLGNNNPVTLNDFIAAIERATGKKALIERREIQPGDVDCTWADIRLAQREFGYTPMTTLDEGLRQFVTWYRETGKGARCLYTPNNTRKIRRQEAILEDQHYKDAIRQDPSSKPFLDLVLHVGEREIESAEQSLLNALCGPDAIKGKTFLDLGCSGGLASLAALRLGAKRVLSLDIHPYSLRAAQHLRSRYGNNTRWDIRYGSALDKELLASLGTFDIVHAWGSLHSTGDLFSALENAKAAVAPGGLIFLGVFNDNRKHFLEGTSQMWVRIKQFYRGRGRFIQKAMRAAYGTYIIAGVTATGHNPLTYIRSYHRQRGMDFWGGIEDWFVRYPYEFTTAEDVVERYERSGFKKLKIEKARALGCNQFVFRREASDRARSASRSSSKS